MICEAKETLFHYLKYPDLVFYNEVELLNNEVETLNNEVELLNNVVDTLNNEVETLNNVVETLNNEVETLNNVVETLNNEVELSNNDLKSSVNDLFFSRNASTLHSDGYKLKKNLGPFSFFVCFFKTFRNFAKYKNIIMDIKVLGTGCSNCKSLEKSVINALSEMNIVAHVEKVEDIQKIMSFGIMRTPGLVINDKVVMSGRVPNMKELKEIIEKNK
jgi:small redox-active disulfide protein 2